MARRAIKPAGPVRYAGNAELADGFRRYLIDFIAHLAARHYSPHTQKNRRIDLGYFIVWCEERGIERPAEVTRAHLERYRQHLFHYRRADNGRPLCFASQTHRLIAVRVFFQWLARQHHLLYNPASELELPRSERQLPRHILSVAEIEQVMNALDAGSARGLRDRAMLETLYSTGMRRSELTGLRIVDVDLAHGTILIRQGKGKKDRVVPVGERACRWIERYLAEVRPGVLDEIDDGALFLASHGEAMQAKQLSYIVKQALERAQLARFQDTHANAACHLFRHACATHMLENGADIRYIQAILGHENLATTAVYTQVSIGKLKEIHAATHPARLARRKDADEAPAQSGADDALAGLLDALAREEDEAATDAVAADAVPANALPAGRR